MANTDLSVNGIVSRLVRLAEAMDGAQRELEDAEQNSVILRHAYDVAEAKAFLVADGSNADIRKRKALLACEEQKLNADTAEAFVKAVRSRLRTLSTRIEVGRSLSAALRGEANL